MFQHSSRAGIRYTVPLAALVLLAACGPTGAGTFAPAATATPTPAPSCATLLPGAGPALPPAQFPDVSFPQGAVATVPLQSLGGSGQYTLFAQQVCFTGTIADVTGPFSQHHSVVANLLAHAWSLDAFPTVGFPYAGIFQQACQATATCLNYNPGLKQAPQIAPRFISLEALTDHGGGLITYQQQLAVILPQPVCTQLMQGPLSTTQFYSYLIALNAPYPPATRAGLGNSSTGKHYQPYCSAGTWGTIEQFWITSEQNAGNTTKMLDPNTLCVMPKTGNVFWVQNIGPDPTYPNTSYWNTITFAPYGGVTTC
jgi:hypothetical protein